MPSRFPHPARGPAVLPLGSAVAAATLGRFGLGGVGIRNLRQILVRLLVLIGLEEVGGMEEGGFFQADINEGGLDPR